MPGGVALLFIDGVGLGIRNPEQNPLARGNFLLSQFEADGVVSGEALPLGGTLHAVDATFGIAGRPQSATNQTALLTGQPAPALLGRHLQGFPNGALAALLARHSMVRRLVRSGLGAAFANGYPAGLLDTLGLARRPSAQPDLELAPRIARRLKPSAFQLAVAAAGIALRTLDDVRADEALTHDIDGRQGRAHGFDVPRRTPQEAARILWHLGEEADLVLFEHSLADEAGHARDFAAAANALETFDQFARAVVAQRPAQACVLVCSDHGNVEELSTRSHTRNRVPVLSFCPPERSHSPLTSLDQVSDTVLALLGVPVELLV